MIDFLKYRIPIRIRLTLWYALLMAATIAALVIYLTAQLRGTLRDSVDKSLQRTVSNTVAGLDLTEFDNTDRLSFGLIEESSINSSGFVMRLVSPQGEVWDTVGETRSIRDWGTITEGYSTYQGIGDEDDEWRALSQPILATDGNVIGWVQAAQSLGAITETIFDLQEQVLLAIPFIVILAGFGGYFLANRALRPIQRITDTAREITAQDLSRRLDYDGPKDEVGNLADTFDQMIARLGSSFERERQFSSDAAHELRTPLNAILGWAQLLADCRRSDAAEMRRGLETIARNARAQTQIIEDLLDMSRIVSGKLRLQIQSVDLRSVVEAAVATVRPSAEAKGIRLTELLDSTIGPVLCDAHRIQQVVWNLMANAVKFTPKGGKIQVILERSGSYAEISVSDTGEGIEPEFLPYVFDRFRQGDGSLTRKHGGLGLGLSIAKQIADMHGGSIQAQSGGVGQGATFTFRLPLPIMQVADSSAHQLVTGETIRECLPSSLSGITVLVVDDDVDALELVKRVLEEYQARVIVAGSPTEAMVRLGEHIADVLISDISMPDVEGYELIRRVRALPKASGGDIPAAALTAYSRPDDRTRSLLAGYQAHVRKPVEPIELVAVVAALAGRTGRR